MAEPALSPRMTVAEFYDWHDGSDTRHELVRGVPVAMAPPSGRHAVIVSNIQGSLQRQIPLPCRVLPGGGVAHGEAGDECRVPDIFVSCETTPPRYFTSPRVIVEVLSPSTEKEDRTDKLDFYQSFASVEAILFVWQDKRRVQLQTREGVHWLTQDFIGIGTVRLAVLNLAMSLEEIYAGLDLPTEPAA